MFGRFTNKSRRAVFFARDAALEEGSPQIELSHLLIGLQREDKESTDHFIAEHPAVERLREVDPIRGPATDLTKIKFSEKTKHAFRWAASSSDRERPNDIEIRHLLVGLLKATEATEELGGDRTNIVQRVWDCIVGRVGGVR